MGKLARKIARTKKNKPSAFKQNNQEQLLINNARECKQKHDYHLAVKCYEKALAHANNDKILLYELFDTYLVVNNYDKAEKLIESHFIKLGKFDHCLAKGILLSNEHKWEEALDWLKKAENVDQNSPEVCCFLGEALQKTGNVQSAVNYYTQAMELRANYHKPYSELCSIYYRNNDKEALRNLLKKIELLVNEPTSSIDTRRFYFLLGLFYDRIDDYNKSFYFLEKANSLSMVELNYNLKDAENHFKYIKANITHELIRELEKQGDPDKSPIFIIGMPRSGTSLLEQILSCHDEIQGLGEMQFFWGEAKFFDFHAPLSSSKRLSSTYLEKTAQWRDKSPFFTDKLPQNFLFAGLIKATLPNAKIIHCQREPLDTCFSCYKADFMTHGLFYSYDLRLLGKYYLLYSNLMDYWEKILPGQIYNVRYEDIVRNPEMEIRKLLEHCNLPWQKNCLEFYKSSRIVETASKDQVTKPLYDSSIQRWKKYQNELQPLIELIGPINDRYFMDAKIPDSESDF